MTTFVNTMTSLALQPGTWTELPSNLFQIKGQKVVRLAVANRMVRDDGGFTHVAPAAEQEAFFLTPGYGDKPIKLKDYFNIAGRPINEPVYAMPDDDEVVNIVAMEWTY